MQTINKIKVGNTTYDIGSSGGGSETQEISIYPDSAYVAPFENLKGYINGKLLTVIGFVTLTINEEYGFSMFLPSGVNLSSTLYTVFAGNSFIFAPWCQDMAGPLVFNGGGVYGYCEVAVGDPYLYFNVYTPDGDTTSVAGKQVFFNFTVPIE